MNFPLDEFSGPLGPPKKTLLPDANPIHRLINLKMIPRVWLSCWLSKIDIFRKNASLPQFVDHLSRQNPSRSCIFGRPGNCCPNRIRFPGSARHPRPKLGHNIWVFHVIQQGVPGKHPEEGQQKGVGDCRPNGTDSGVTRRHQSVCFVRQLDTHDQSTSAHRQP